MRNWEEHFQMWKLKVRQKNIAEETKGLERNSEQIQLPKSSVVQYTQTEYTLFFNPRAETNEERMNIIHPLIHEPKQAR